jgi:hypothetical protein
MLDSKQQELAYHRHASRRTNLAGLTLRAVTESSAPVEAPLVTDDRLIVAALPV